MGNDVINFGIRWMETETWLMQKTRRSFFLWTQRLSTGLISDQWGNWWARSKAALAKKERQAFFFFSLTRVNFASQNNVSSSQKRSLDKNYLTFSGFNRPLSQLLLLQFHAQAIVRLTCAWNCSSNNLLSGLLNPWKAPVRLSTFFSDYRYETDSYFLCDPALENKPAFESESESRPVFNQTLCEYQGVLVWRTAKHAPRRNTHSVD